MMTVTEKGSPKIDSSLSTLWTEQQKAEMIRFISDPAHNGGNSLPDGTDLAAVFDQIQTLSFGVWANGSPTLCLSIAPYDPVKRTGIFHVAGDGRLHESLTRQLALGFLGQLAKKGISIRAFTPSKAVMRWGRRLGFQVWGRDPELHYWVGAFVAAP